MPSTSLTPPTTDPTPIFELFRGAYGTELLTAAVAHFDLFGKLAAGPMAADDLRRALGLAERPFVVLTTALRAMGLLSVDRSGRFSTAELAREHLTPGRPFDVSGYIGLAAESPGVLAMVERLRTNRPAGAKPEETGAAFIYREGIESAMEREEPARRLTLALLGRARNVAPVLARNYPLGEARLLLDVGGGTGLYSIAYLQTHPDLRAIVWDRPEVLKIAHELAEAHGVADRLECHSGDMFTDPVPHGADVVLVSNVLHDWDVPECRALVGRLAQALAPGRRLLIHDVFLNDTLDGPLPIALYSAALFALTEGRAYSAAEYRSWLQAAGLKPGAIVPTLIHCGVLPATKSK
ncbi:MAG: methyltransferase domain-containing protein [Isosphaeraceae bacterium]|nr:methyltransferase domain-containing protein [Isosphaeraceae bacterium]